MRTPVDLMESYDGDLQLAGGDLQDTGVDYAQAIFQAIRSVLSNKPGEFPIFPNSGFQADNFEGRINSRELGIEITQAVKNAIVNNTNLYSAELDIQAYPLGKSKIALRIKVLTVADTNQTFLLAYDTAENMLNFMIPDESLPKNTTVKVQLPPTYNPNEA